MELTLVGSSHHVYHEAGLACTAIHSPMSCGDSGEMAVSPSVTMVTATPPVWPFLLWACIVTETTGLQWTEPLCGCWLSPVPHFQMSLLGRSQHLKASSRCPNQLGVPRASGLSPSPVQEGKLMLKQAPSFSESTADILASFQGHPTPFLVPPWCHTSALGRTE